MTMHELNAELKHHGFWQINIGHVLVMISMVGAFIVWWSSFGSLPRETAQDVARLTETIKGMNASGDTWSQLAVTRNQGAISALDVRISALERNYYELNSKLTDVQSKLSVIATLLEADRKPKK